jgi:transposase
MLSIKNRWTAMQTSQSRRRRTHDAQFKAVVMAACREPGASVAAVAQAHDVNANLVRQWLVGRGMKRCGVEQAAAANASSALSAAPVTDASPVMPFVSVQLPAPAPAPAGAQPHRPGQADQAIHIELTRTGAKLVVRWPAAHASACASWLGELAQVLSR